MNQPEIVNVTMARPFCLRCCYDNLHPSAECGRPGLWPEVSIFMVRLVLPKARIRFVPSTGFGGDGKTREGSDMWNIRTGVADVAAPFFLINSERSHLNYTGLRSAGRLVIAVKQFHLTPALKVVDLGYNPLGLWAGLFFCFCIWRVFKYISRRAEPTPFELFCVTLGPRIKLSLYRKMRANLGFWVGFFLSAIGSYVILIFVGTRHQRADIYNFDSFVTEVVADRYRPIFSSEFMMSLYYTEINHDLMTSLAYNHPIIAEGYVNGAEFVKRDAIDGQKHAFVGVPLMKDQLAHLVCDVEFITDTTTMESFYVVYRRRGFNFTLSPQDAQVLGEEVKRLSLKYFPKKLCQSHKKPGRENLLSFQKLRGLFVFLAIFLSGSIIVLILENVGFCIHRR